MQRIAIIGTGLMGGSLGLALKAFGKPYQVSAWSRKSAEREKALRLGVCDEVFQTPEETVADADISVFCTSVSSISPLIEQCMGNFKGGSLVTDVGSTKTDIVRRCETVFAGKPFNFIGSHPMTGSEKSGQDHAARDLYRGAVVALTPVSGSDRDLNRLQEFWKSVGGIPVTMDPEEHDRVIALTSHLTYLAASALASTVYQAGGAESAGMLCGPGFTDTTRVAGSAPAIWRDIAAGNTENILDALDAFIAELSGIKSLMEQREFQWLQNYLEESGRARAELLAAKKTVIEANS
ncbi:MAG: prephenate dehydrogenase [Kiritimatiellia bacterium]